MSAKTGTLIATAFILLCAAVSFADDGNVSTPAEAADDASLTKPVPIHALLQESRDLGFALSPDGSRLARLEWTPSGPYLVIHDTRTGETISDIPFGSGDVNSLTWLDDRMLLYVRNGTIKALNYDGTDHRTLVAILDDDDIRQRRGVARFSIKDLRYWSLKSLLQDDFEHILVQSYDTKGVPAVVRVNIYTGEQTTVVKEPGLKVDDWLVDHDGEVRFGLRYKKDKLEILTRDEADGRWVVYDDFAAGSENTLGHNGRTYLTKRINFESFAFDENAAYLAANQDSDRFRIVKYDLETRQIIEDVYVSEKFDIGGPASDWTTLLFDEAERSLVGIRVEEEKVGTVWFDDRFQAYQDKLDKLRPDSQNWILSWNSDASVLLVYSYSDIARGKYSIFRPESNRILTFSGRNEELEGATLSRTQVVSFPARDGYLLDGYLNLPTGGVESARGLIMMPHGGPWARDHWRFNPWVQFFATRGYAVLRVNFRGSTGYGREHLLAGLKKIDTVMVDDIADGARWALSEGIGAEGSVFIFGHSYGGYAALMSSIRYSDLYSAAVSWSAPVDLIKQIKDYKENDSYFAYEYWKTAVGDPRKEKASLRAISPTYNTDKIEIPIVVFHGEDDRKIDKEQIVEFENALRSSEVVAQVVIMDDEGHTFTKENNISYVLEKALRFFDQYGG